MNRGAAWDFVRVRGWWSRYGDSPEPFIGEAESMILNPRFIVGMKAYGGGNKTIVVLELGMVAIVDMDFENMRALIGMSADKKFEEMYYKTIREIREKEAVASGKKA